jgi:hypothetical protein
MSDCIKKGKGETLKGTASHKGKGFYFHNEVYAKAFALKDSLRSRSYMRLKPLSFRTSFASSFRITY